MRIVLLFLLTAYAVTGAPIRAADGELGGVAHVSKRVLQDLLSRDVTFQETVAEQILNMTTRGTARVDCQIGLDLVPNSQAANLRLLMAGEVLMDDAVSSMRSVRVYSSSRTEINGFKDVLFDAQGLRLLPSRATGRASIQVHDIESPRRFVERIAWRRVDRMQPQAEEAAGERAARRAEQQLESEAGKPLGQLQNEYVKHVRQPLSDRGAFPDARLATTSDHLSVRLYRRPGEPRTASNPLPTLANDVALCLGDRFVNEMITPLLAGKTITDRQFAEILQTITGTTPQPLWVHDRAERWSVTAAKDRPLVLSFAGDTVSIMLRTDGVIRGEERLAQAVEISAKYTLESTPDGPHLIRTGDVAVECGQADAADLGRFLARKFSGVFPKDIYFDGLTPPDGGAWGKLRRLQLTQLSSRDGWLAIGYVLRSSVPATDAPNVTLAR